MDLPTAGREYVYWPMWSEASLTAVDIKIGGYAWTAMEKVSSYSPALPVAAGAQWFRALLAGPNASSNPAGTVVVSQTGTATFRVNHDPEVILRSGGLVRLTA